MQTSTPHPEGRPSPIQGANGDINPNPEIDTSRQNIMGVVARAKTADICALWESAVLSRDDQDINFRWLRAPESGLVMVQGQISGDGRPFNLGEMTLTRCTLQTDRGQVGTAYVQGRDHTHARIAALVDALSQDPEHRDWVHDAVVRPLSDREAKLRQTTSAEVEKTKVDFFTLVRGED